MHGQIPSHKGDLLDLYTFADGIPSHNAVRAAYCYGWWTLPTLKLAFFRPLSSLAHHFDEFVLGPYAWRHHVQGIFWYLACVLGMGLLYRRFLSARTAALAVLLFAIDDAHWTPVAWLANRNSLISVVPALWGWLAWLRGTRNGWKWGKQLGILSLTLGLLGGETALGLVLLWGTEHVAAKRRMRELWPIALLLLVYIVAYKTMGYGAAGSGAYIDPAKDPLRFLLFAATRMPTLAGGLIAFSPTEIAAATLPLQLGLAAWGLLLAILLAWLLRCAWPDFAEKDRRALPWLVIGGLCALLPPSATWPSLRTTLVVSLVPAALIAMLLGQLGDKVRAGLALRWQRWVRGTLWFLHAGLAPLIFTGASLGAATLAPRWQTYIEAPIFRDVGGKRVVLVTSPDPLIGFYTPSTLSAQGLPEPRAWSVLSAAIGDVAVTRKSAQRLELETLGPPLLASAPEQLVHDPQHAYRAGDRVQGAGFVVDILATNEVGPTRVAFTFDKPLDDAEYLPVWWHDGQLRRWPLPGVGVRMVLKREAGVLGV